jgi:hypothetical protein
MGSSTLPPFYLVVAQISNCGIGTVLQKKISYIYLKNQKIQK